MAPRRPLPAVLLTLLLAACAAPPPPSATPGPAAPRFVASGVEAEVYGSADGYPLGNRSTFFRLRYLVGSHSHLDEIFDSRVAHRAARPSELVRATSVPDITYTFENQTRTLEDYLARHPTTGLLVARGDTILVERYQYGRTDRQRFTSWSMGKTVTAMLVGIAIAEGRIRSVDDPAERYVPELAGTEYGRTSLRHLLQMSSGVKFVEKYTGDDDVAELARRTFLRLKPGGVEAVKPFNERAVPAGTKFSYASVETQVLGLVLARAVGRAVTAYLEEKIWQPMGAEADATWLVDDTGQEVTFCCVNAVLRDWGRLGLLLAHDGRWRGRQVIPAEWLLAATTVSADQPHLAPRVATSFFGYGYQTWIVPSVRRRFALLGVRGQSIYVDPTSRLVMVHTAVRRQPSGDPGNIEAGALWLGLLKTFGS
ncbi:MAG TPA: serine hydrolase [Methylomirabilota bacterium]|nr:serine hydrolase [Methylomirabilota bacterium]